MKIYERTQLKLATSYDGFIVKYTSYRKNKNQSLSSSNQLGHGAIAKFTKKLKMTFCIPCQVIFRQGEKLPISISGFKPEVAMLGIIFSLRTISACIWLETVSASPYVCMSMRFS